MKKQPESPFTQKFNDLISEQLGLTVSILLDGLNKKESYSGVIREEGEDYIGLDLNADNIPGRKYTKFYIRKDAIISFLIYTEEKD